MLCPHCGTQIEGTAAFCDQCGKPIKEPDTSNVSSVVPVAPAILSPVSAAKPQPVKVTTPAPAAMSFPQTSYSAKWNRPDTADSHWNTLIRGLEISPSQFYSAVGLAINERKIPEVHMAVMDVKEGGIFSAKRQYLRVSRRELVLDICGAPFGDSFFVSSWLGPKPAGCLLSLIFVIPFTAGLYLKHLRPLTYYHADTASMFLTAVHSALQKVIDQFIEARGLRKLSEDERKPINRDFFRR